MSCLWDDPKTIWYIWCQIKYFLKENQDTFFLLKKIVWIKIFPYIEDSNTKNCIILIWEILIKPKYPHEQTNKKIPQPL